MYSPKIKEESVRSLYRLKQVLRKPITVLANEAIELYLRDKALNLNGLQTAIVEGIPAETTENKRSALTNKGLNLNY